MWVSRYSKRVRGLPMEKVWEVWRDVDQWPTWQADIDYARIDGDFAVGNSIRMKNKQGPEVNFEIIALAAGCQFTDPYALFWGEHDRLS